MSAKIAIVGLGRIGTSVLEQLLGRHKQGIEIVCVSEVNDTPGRRKAEATGIPVLSLEKVIGQGDAVDMIFDMTGIAKVRKELRERLFESHNKHTVIVPENVAYLLWAVLSGEHVPGKDHRSGY
jgi:glyceraldehyde-3-phosphate dehydrogenase/erythrose-4-phosphate dehydrogenase